MTIEQFIGPLFSLLKWPFEAYQRRKARRLKEEILNLLRQGPWAGAKHRPFTFKGYVLVYEGELMDASSRLKKLGEIKLHQVLRELQSEGMITCSDHEHNRWFALY